MLPRPQAQVGILRYLGQGRAFLAEVAERRQILSGVDGVFRPVVVSASH